MRKTQLASCIVIVSLLGSSQFTGAADPAHSDQPSVAPSEAISKLKEGNGRYTGGNLQHPGQTAERRTELQRLSIRLPRSSVAPIHACRPKLSSIGDSVTCLLCEWQET